MPTDLNVADFFPPSNQADLDTYDHDFGASGPVIIKMADTYVWPRSKKNTLYVLDTTH